jgi:RNA-directed DNA polymerase
MPLEQRDLASRYAYRSEKGRVIVVRLATPEKIRNLQRALYQCAKRSPGQRFYSLYDKVYRQDVLAHAYAVCRANGGAAGPDGMTFEFIEESEVEAMLTKASEQLRTKTYKPGPVRRVYIPKANGGERPLGIPNIIDRVVQTAAKLVLEPIFEADFESDSYGFRPRRSAHDALEAVGESLAEGMCWVIDADIEKYFDSIPHDNLMKVVASRVVDSSMLALIRMFLAAPVVDERKGGGPRRPMAGVPQGGVVSPLLANLYLHLLDRNFRRRVEQGDLSGRLVRYCDDFVLVSRRHPARELAWLEGLMGRLGLKLHPDKTKVVDSRRESFDFLGYRVRRRVGRLVLDISPKSVTRIHERLREPTKRTFQSLPQLVSELNSYIRGARAYFKLAPWWSRRRLDSYVATRLAIWFRRKRGQKHPAWSLVSGHRPHREYGVLEWAPVRPWNQDTAWAH